MKKVKKAPGRKKIIKRPVIRWKTLNIRQAAAVISGHLGNHGVKVFLVGSGAAAMYSSKVKPKTLDFVMREYHVEHIEKFMRELGFSPRELRSFASPGTSFEVNFLPPPVAVGDEPVEKFKTLSSKNGKLHLLNPTDCVRHRLAAWYRWGDPDAFEQAVAVASAHVVDRTIISQWSEWEWSTDKCQEFFAAVGKSP